MASPSIAPSLLIASAIAAALIITGCFDVVGDTGDVFGISIEARDPNNGKRLGKSTETGVFGAYQLKVPAKGLQRLIQLIFTTPLPSSQTFVGFFLITQGSEVVLDVRLESPNQVIIDDLDGGGYQVDQKRIRIGGGKSFTFSGPEFAISTPQQAEFTINGRSNDCIKASENSAVTINVQNFSATNCNVGIRAEGKAIVSIGAGEGFQMRSGNAGVKAGSQSITSLASGEEFLINSTGDFGIRAGGQSSVIVDLLVPPADCEIFGTRGDISQESGSALISVPAGCLVP